MINSLVWHNLNLSKKKMTKVDTINLDRKKKLQKTKQKEKSQKRKNQK